MLSSNQNATLPAFLLDGHAYVQVPAKRAENTELFASNASIPMTEATSDVMANLPFGNDNALDVDNVPNKATLAPNHLPPSKQVRLLVDALPDWSLGGSKTLQMGITRFDAPFTLDFNSPMAFDTSNGSLTFNTKLAVHRGEGVLHITFSDEATGKQKIKSVSFSTNFNGGNLAESYQNVSVPVPAGFRSGTVDLSFEYLGLQSNDVGIEPYFFMAQTRLCTTNRKTTVIRDPLMLSDLESSPDAIWMTAPLPSVITKGTEVSVKIGRSVNVLMKAEPPQVKLVDDFGHTLSIQSDQACSALLYVDSRPVEKIDLNAGDNHIHIPTQFLTGQTRHISLRDRSGSITLMAGHVLCPFALTPADVVLQESTAPFNASLFAQTPRRFAGLRAVMEHATPETDLAQVAYAMSVVEGGYDNVKLKPLTFQRPKSPKVSIIIPAHNKVEVTYLALCSLLTTHNDASFEVIVVDDASTDETAELETIVSGITVLHNETAQRFIRACNRGAEAAQGEYIVLLNNDVEVTNGWLDELVAGFDRFDNVGLVGSKLLYPNGRLQDAGGIIWGSGDPWNYGSGQNPEEPRFSYARQADYLSGAAMMTTAKLWKKVGGLSSYLEPMYFEDTDFAFKIRDAGYTTWFIPSSVVYHYEGMTSGTDVTTGYKKYQEVNRPKFKRQWAKAYGNHSKIGHQPDLEKDRGIVGRVLFVDYSTPRADQDAGSYAAIQEIKLVQSLGYKVTFLPGNLAYLGSYTETLQKMGVEVIYAPFSLSTQEYLSRHGAEFDAVYITRYHVAQDVMNHVKTYAPQAKILFNNADLHFLRELRTARAEGDPELLKKARETRRHELEVIDQVDVVLSYNDVEHSVIQAYTDGDSTVVKCPWVVDVADKIAPLKSRKGLSFLGSFRHHPNAEGIIWFVREIMPALTAPSAKETPHLSIYGAGITDEIEALANENVDPVGFVDEVSDAFDGHRVFVAPLRSGAGIKGKVLGALAHGIPCVLTPTAAEGIGLRNGHDCFIAETPVQWAEAIHKLMTDDALWNDMSQNARSYIKDTFSFETGRAQMRTAFEAAGLYKNLD